MSRWAKIGWVSVGYLLALVAGGVAGHLYDVRVSALPYDTSGGMYAAGEMMSGLGVFLVAALAPTLLMLWFLRGNHELWRIVGFAALGFSTTGLLAVLMPLMTHDTPRNPAQMLLSLLGLAQLLGVPLWTAAFVLFALLAPAGALRRRLVIAVGIELVIGVCAVIHWTLPGPPF